MVEKERILVVEDDPAVAHMFGSQLTEAGYVVQVAPDGLAALGAFEERRPALVTLDLVLPTISGLRLVRLFKRRRPDVPVLVVTPLAFEQAEDAARSGADDFLTKPLDLDQLLQKVRFHLRAPRWRQFPAVATAHPWSRSPELVRV